MIDFVAAMTRKTALPAKRLVAWLSLSESTYFSWKERYGRANEHNGHIPRDHWLTGQEKEAILAFQASYPLEGYRRLTYMMMDRDVVAVSPTSVYRVLKAAGRIGRWGRTASSPKGTGFVQPLRAHEHWHIDMSYVNICGTFYYMMSILDGYSRAIIHHEIRTAMTQADAAIIVQRALELHEEELRGRRPRIISDNGPQFVGRDFKLFLRQVGMDHVPTSPYYPQSNGKLERYHRTVKTECIRVKTPLTLEEAQHLVSGYVRYYNETRLHSAIGYVTPMDKLRGQEERIFRERDRRLEAARDRRAQARASERSANPIIYTSHN